VRFAFYGRTSTLAHQNLQTSRGWQREAAEGLVAGHGSIVAEFFDAGCSRRVPWQGRPQARALLAALADPNRVFDAVVVGEYERAFAAGQLEALVPEFQRHGVAVWLPEAGGPVEFGSPLHQALVTVLGAQSQREVLRARHRVLAAMRTQVVEQGRYLGGRPPYGYRLVDAGPHPNRAQARWGRRLQRLGPDPATAPQVRWIFALRLAGQSPAQIARELNERGVPCPSGADRLRNRHRSGWSWSLRTVIEILRNPRYTGREVWNRVTTDRGGTRGSGSRVSAREWVVSARLAHAALVSEADFVAAQSVRVQRVASDGTVRVFGLAGLVRCGLCGRWMHGRWAHGRAGYECRHGHSGAGLRPPGMGRLHRREDHLVALITAAASIRGSDNNVDELASYLRDHELVITCGPDTAAVVHADAHYIADQL
jgi:DNA invertase Pin-like site-specific DNA recombinase